MNEFQKTYDKILNARMLYEHAMTDYKMHLAQIDSVSIDTADEFYSNVIEINDETDDIILEEHKNAQFSKSLVNKIFNARNFTQVSANEVFSRCNDSIRSSYSIGRDIPMYIFDFSFSNEPEFICSIFLSFHIEFSKNAALVKEKYEYEAQRFKDAYSKSSGLCADVGSCIMAILNLDRRTETTVVHELYHYLQFILKKERNVIEDGKFKNIEELQLSIDDLKYLFDDYEFETNIKVDLCNQLDEMYWKLYSSKLSKKKFVEKVIRKVKKNPKNVVSLFFDDLLKMKNNDTTQLRMLAACFLLEDKQYLLNAIRWLKETFK